MSEGMLVLGGCYYSVHCLASFDGRGTAACELGPATHFDEREFRVAADMLEEGGLSDAARFLRSAAQAATAAELRLS